MPDKPSDAAPHDKWTLIRRARQLITLRGPSGPRRGPAMNELHVVPDGAILLRNGVIEHLGPSRRVENLAGAKKAQEIDACGGVVMPAFVDPDAVLVFPTVSSRRSDGNEESPLRVISLRRLELGALEAAADWTRYGALTVGAHTGHAFDLRNTAKVLRVHKRCQSKPLRIRSIVSPRLPRGLDPSECKTHAAALTANLIGKWLPAIRKRKLAAIVEFTVDYAGTSLSIEQIRLAAVAAAGLGYSIRIRALEPLHSAARDLAVAAGSVALIGPLNPPGSHDTHLANTGCIHVLTAAEAFRENCGHSEAVRHALDEGAALALASGYKSSGVVSFNPQFLLHLACDRFGMTAEEAIVATTYNAACSLRMSHVTGSLEPGKSADLVVMDVPDYRELPRRAGHSDVRLAIRAGRVVFSRAPLILD